MATQQDNGFTTYDFSDEELISAATFTQMQRMYIQTQRAHAAMDIAALEFTPDNQLAFVKAHSYQQGFIAAMDFLLDHENSEAVQARWEELKQNAKPI